MSRPVLGVLQLRRHLHDFCALTVELNCMPLDFTELTIHIHRAQVLECVRHGTQLWIPQDVLLTFRSLSNRHILLPASFLVPLPLRRHPPRHQQHLCLRQTHVLATFILTLLPKGVSARPRLIYQPFVPPVLSLGLSVFGHTFPPLFSGFLTTVVPDCKLRDAYSTNALLC